LQNLQNMKNNIFKTLIVWFFSTLCFLPTAWSKYQYFEKIKQFGTLTDYQMTTFNNFVKNNPKASPEAIAAVEQAIELQKQTLWNRVENLKALYGRSFIQKTATKEDRKALVFSESSLSIAVHRQLELLHDFIKATESGSSSAFSSKALKLSEKMTKISTDLIAGNSIGVPPKMGISQVFQASQKLGKSICSLLVGFCSRASLSQLMDSLDESNFLRGKPYQFEGMEAAKANLDQHAKSVFILIGNHDQPLMDIALARKVALQLGSEKHITMTRKSVYPIPPPESAGDVVFVVDNDPKSNPVQQSLDILAKNILAQDSHRVSLAVYPEGMLPYTGGQMPMTVKEGAFVIARKLAHQLSQQGIPVFLVQMKSNVIEHLTATEDIAAKVVMQNVEKVPDTVIDRKVPDVWIEEKRLQAENSFNSHRAQTQIDVFNTNKVPSSSIPYSMNTPMCSMLFAP
jgi:hypothetical protein